MELALALAVLGGLAGLVAATDPRPPAPASPGEVWALRAGPALQRLASDLARATAAPAWPAAIVADLGRDAVRIEQVGPPPAAGAADVWRPLVAHVKAAATMPAPDWVATRSELEVAAMEVEALPTAPASRSRG